MTIQTTAEEFVTRTGTTLADWGIEGESTAPIYIEDGNVWADLPMMRIHLNPGTSKSADAGRDMIRALYPTSLTEGRFHAVASTLPECYSLERFAQASGGVVTGDNEISYGDQVVTFVESDIDGNLWPVAGSLPV